MENANQNFIKILIEFKFRGIKSAVNIYEMKNSIHLSIFLDLKAKKCNSVICFLKIYHFYQYRLIYRCVFMHIIGCYQTICPSHFSFLICDMNFDEMRRSCYK